MISRSYDQIHFQSSGQSNWSLSIAIGLFICTCVICVLYFIGIDLTEPVLYLLAMALLSILPIIFLRPRGIDLLTFVLLTPTVFFSVEALTLRLGFYNYSFYTEQANWPHGLTDDSVRKAAGLVLMGHLLLWVAYLSPVSSRIATSVVQRLRPFLTDERPQPVRARVLTAFGVGIATRVILVASGLNGYFSDTSKRTEALGYIQYLKMVADLATLSLMLYSYAEMNSRRPNWKMLAALYAIEILSLVLEGFKAPIAYRFVYLAIISGVVKKKSPAWLLPAGLVALVIVFPMIEAARVAISQGHVAVGDLASIVTVMGNAAGDYGGENKEKESLGSHILRSSGQLGPLSMVVQYCDVTGTCWYGMDYLFPIFSVIPRAIWRSKPMANHGQWLTQVVYGYDNDSSETTTVPGNFYLNFGVIGVVIGFLVLGLLGRVLSAVIDESRSARFVPLIPTLVHTFGMPQPDLGPYIAQLMQSMIVYSLVLRLLTRVPGVTGSSSSSHVTPKSR